MPLFMFLAFSQKILSHQKLLKPTDPWPQRKIFSGGWNWRWLNYKRSDWKFPKKILAKIFNFQWKKDIFKISGGGSFITQLCQCSGKINAVANLSAVPNEF